MYTTSKDVYAENDGTRDDEKETPLRVGARAGLSGTAWNSRGPTEPHHMGIAQSPLPSKYGKLEEFPPQCTHHGMNMGRRGMIIEKNKKKAWGRTHLLLLEEIG